MSTLRIRENFYPPGEPISTIEHAPVIAQTANVEIEVIEGLAAVNAAPDLAHEIDFAIRRGSRLAVVDVRPIRPGECTHLEDCAIKALAFRLATVLAESTYSVRLDRSPKSPGHRLLVHLSDWAQVLGQPAPKPLSLLLSEAPFLHVRRTLR